MEEKSKEDIEITTPTQEEIDYVKEMITQTGKVNIKYLMDMTDYSFEVVALSRALLEKDGFLEEPEIDDEEVRKVNVGFLSFITANEELSDFKRGTGFNFIANSIIRNTLMNNNQQKGLSPKDERLGKKILTLMRDKGTTNIDTISKILRADWNKVALFRATLEGSIITEPKIAGMLDIEE